MSSPKYNDKLLIELAKRTLGLAAHINDSLVPTGYLIELGKHVGIRPQDTMFTLNTEPGTGFGRIICLETGCNRAVIPLTKRIGAADGGKSEGIGALSAYRNHISEPAHKASRLARLKSAQSSRNTPGINTANATPNKPGRLGLRKIVDGQLASSPATPELSNTRAVARQSLPNLSARPLEIAPATAQSIPLKRRAEDITSGDEEPVSMMRRHPGTISQTDSNAVLHPSQPQLIQSNVYNNQSKTAPSKRAKVGDHIVNNLNHPEHALHIRNTGVTSNASNATSPYPTNSATTTVQSDPTRLQRLIGELKTVNGDLHIHEIEKYSIIGKKRLTARDRMRLRGTEGQINTLTIRKRELENFITQERSAALQVQALVATPTRASRSSEQIINTEPSNSNIPAIDTPSAPPQSQIINGPLSTVMDLVSVAGGMVMSGIMAKNEYDSDEDTGPFDRDGDFYGRGKDKFVGLTAQPGDLQQFFQDAGNAELFDKNASVTTALEKLKLPTLNTLFPGLSIALMPHQVIGVAWMLEKERGTNKGGILSDEMGLGKTVQMIATMSANKSDDPAVKTTLIVAPLALLDQWKLEIELKTNDSMKVLIYHGQGKAKQKKELMKYDVVLTTFQSLAMQYPDPVAEEKKEEKKKTRKRKDDFIESDSDDSKAKSKKKKKVEPGILITMNWHRIVLDEAQFIKNKRTRVSRAVTQLHSKLKWCLTGTPITNGLGDIYPLLRFLKIRPWYDWDEYNGHITKLERKSPDLATTRLQAILMSCMLRRKKDTQLDGRRLIELPPKDVHLCKLDFTPDERDIYKMVETKSQQIFNKYLRAGTVLKNYAQVLVLLLRLRQICSHTALITEEEDVIVDEDLENSNEANRDELIQAQTVAGREFVQKLKAKLKEVALGRMAAEKESEDAAIEDEECPVCFDMLNEPITTSCMHFFCRECINGILDGAHVVDAENPDKYKRHERPCPVCRNAISKDTIFSRKAFEPTDDELNGIPTAEVGDKETDEFKETRSWKSVDDDDDDDVELPDIADLFAKESSVAKPSPGKPEGNGKGKGKATRRSTRKARPTRRIVDSDSDSEDEDDGHDTDMSDFIVQSDEDEEEKDARKVLRQRLGKRITRRTVQSESEDDDLEVVIDPKKKKAQINNGPIKVLSKLLPSTKMMYMAENLQQWAKDHPGEKTIVVSQWTQCLDLVSKYLVTKDFIHVKYQGSMDRKKRDSAIRKFMQADEVQVMLMSLKCGGVGLNLTRGNRVISLDLGWSEAVENQAFDRVHRLGQTRPVVVHRLVIKDTVEDRVLALQEKKRNLADGSLGEGSGKKIGRLTVRELARLFGLDSRGNVL